MEQARTILIVDDQHEMRKLLATVLAAPNRQILLAASGEEGVKLAQAACPELILLDVMMPGGMDGFATASALKALPEAAGASIIFMSAAYDDRMKKLALQAGAVACLRKPFDFRLLRKTVECHLRGPSLGHNSQGPPQ